MCRKKRAYDSMRQAKAVIARVLSDRNDVVRAYQCPICDKIHLTKAEAPSA